MKEIDTRVYRDEVAWPFDLKLKACFGKAGVALGRVVLKANACACIDEAVHFNPGIFEYACRRSLGEKCQ